jgi:hypothetical protein
MIDDFDIFQGDFISYSQLMSQITLDPSVSTSGTQYETPRASSYDTLVRLPECSRRKHLPTQGTSVLTVKSDQETHTVCLSLGEYFVDVDIFFYFKDCSLYFIIFKRLYFIFFIYDLKFSFSYLWFEIKLL